MKEKSWESYWQNPGNCDLLLAKEHGGKTLNVLYKIVFHFNKPAKIMTQFMCTGLENILIASICSNFDVISDL